MVSPGITKESTHLSTAPSARYGMINGFMQVSVPLFRGCICETGMRGRRTVFRILLKPVRGLDCVGRCFYPFSGNWTIKFLQDCIFELQKLINPLSADYWHPDDASKPRLEAGVVCRL